jgi:hypothetical protein
MPVLVFGGTLRWEIAGQKTGVPGLEVSGVHAHKSVRGG